MVRELKDQYDIAGMNINLAKSEYTSVGTNNDERLTLDNTALTR